MRKIQLTPPERRLVALGLGVIVCTLFFAYWSYTIAMTAFPFNIDLMWKWWDAEHYLSLMKWGYPAAKTDHRLIAFFPLYPYLSRLVGFVVGDPIVSGLVVSNLCFLGASVLIYRLAKLDYDEETSFRSALWLMVFPTAYMLHAVYTEALFIFLAAGALYSARKGKWLLAGTLVGLASGTRITGSVLIPALAVECWLQNPSFKKWRPVHLAALALGSSGILLYLGINEWIFDDPFFFMKVQNQEWHRQFHFPWKGFWGSIASIKWRRPDNYITTGLMEAVFGAFLIAFAIWSCFKMRLSYAVYVVGCVFLITFTTFWLSNPRLALSVFPVLFALGSISRRREVFAFLLICSLIFHGFFLSQYVVARWAF